MLKFLKTSMVTLLSVCLVLNSIYGTYNASMELEIREKLDRAGYSLAPDISIDSVVDTLNLLSPEIPNPRLLFVAAGKTLRLSRPVRDEVIVHTTRIKHLEETVIPALQRDVARVQPLESDNRQLTTERDQALNDLLLITRARDAAEAERRRLEAQVLPLTQDLDAAKKTKDQLDTVILQLTTEKEKVMQLANGFNIQKKQLIEKDTLIAQKTEEVKRLQEECQKIKEALEGATAVKDGLAPLQEENRTLIEEEDALLARIGEVTGLIDAADTERQKAVERATHLQKMLGEAQAELDAAKNNLGLLKDEKKRIEAENTSLSVAKQSAEEEKVRLQGVEQDLRTQLQAMTAARDDLTRQLEVLQNQHAREVANLTAELAARTHQVTTEKATKISEIEADHAKKVAALTHDHQVELTRVTEAHDQQIKELNAANAEGAAERARLEKEFKNQTQYLKQQHAVAVAALEAKHAAALDEKAREHEQKVQQLRTAHAAEVANTQQDYQQRIDLVQQDLQAAQQGERQLKEEADKLKTTAVKLEEALNKVKADQQQALGKLKAEHTAALAVLEEKNREQAAEAQRQFAEAREAFERDNTALTHTLASLQSQHAIKDAELGSINNKLEKLQQEIDAKTKELESARVALETTESSLKSETLAKDKAESDLRETQALLDTEVQEKTTAQTTLQQTQAAVNQLEAVKLEEITQKEAVLVELEKKKADFELLKEFAEKNIEELKKANEDTRKKVAALGRIFSSNKADLESRMQALSDQYNQEALAEKANHERTLAEAQQQYEQKLEALLNQQESETERLRMGYEQMTMAAHDATAVNLREFGNLLTQGELNLKRTIEEHEAKLRATEEAHAAALADKQATYEAQRKEDLKIYADGLEKMRKKVEEASEKTAQDLAENYMTHSDHDAQIASMRAQLEEDKKAAIKALGVEKDSQIDSVRAQLGQQEIQNATLKTEVVRLSAEKEGLTALNGQLKTKLASEEEEKRKALAEVALLTTQLAESQAQLETTRQELGLVKEESKRLSTENQRLVNEISALTARLETSLKEAQVLIAEMQDLREQHAKTLKDVQAEYTHQEQTLIAAQEARLNQLASEHQQQMAAQKENFEEQINKGKLQLESLASDLEQHQNVARAAETKLKEEFRDLQQAQSITTAAYEERIRALQAQLQVVAQSQETTSAKVVELQNEMISLQQAKESLEARLQQERNSLRQKVEAINAKVDEKRVYVEAKRAETQRMIESLKSQHLQDLTRLQTAYDSFIASAQASKEEEIAALQAAHQSEIQKVQAQHEREVNALQAELQEADRRFTEEKSALERRNADLMSEKAKLGEQEAALRESIDALRDQYNQDKLSLEQEYKSATEDALLKQREVFRKEVEQKLVVLEESRTKMLQRSDAALGKLESRISILTDQLASQRETADALRSRHKALHQLRHQEKLRNDTLDHQLQESGRELEAANAKIKEMESEVKKAKDVKQKLVKLQGTEKELRAMLAQYMGEAENANLKVLQAKFREDTMAGRLKTVAQKSGRHRETIEILLKNYGENIGQVIDQMKALGQKVDGTQSLVPAKRKGEIERLPETLQDFMEFCEGAKFKFDDLFANLSALYETQSSHAQATSSSRSATPSSTRGPTPPLSARSASATRVATPSEDAASITSAGGFSDAEQDVAHQTELAALRMEATKHEETLRTLHTTYAAEREDLKARYQQGQRDLYTDYQERLQGMEEQLRVALAEKKILEQEITDLDRRFATLKADYHEVREENEQLKKANLFPEGGPVSARGYKGDYTPRVNPGRPTKSPKSIKELKTILENLNSSESFIVSLLEEESKSKNIQLGGKLLKEESKSVNIQTKNPLFSKYEVSFAKIAESSLTDENFKVKVSLCLDELERDYENLCLSAAAAVPVQHTLGFLQGQQEWLKLEIKNMEQQEQQQRALESARRPINAGGAITMEDIEEGLQMVGRAHPELVNYTEALERAVVGLSRIINEVDGLINRTQANLVNMNFLTELHTPRFTTPRVSSSASVGTPTSVGKRIRQAASLQEQLLQAMSNTEAASTGSDEEVEDEQDDRTIAYAIASNYEALEPQVISKGVADMLAALRMRIEGANTAQEMGYKAAIRSLETKIQQLTAERVIALEQLLSESSPQKNQIIAALVEERAKSIAPVLMGNIVSEKEAAYKRVLTERFEDVAEKPNPSNTSPSKGAAGKSNSSSSPLNGVEMLLALNVNSAWLEQMDRYIGRMQEIKERMAKPLHEWLEQQVEDTAAGTSRDLISLILARKWVGYVLGTAEEPASPLSLQEPESFLLEAQQGQFDMVLRDLVFLISNIQTAHTRYKEPIENNTALVTEQESTPLSRRSAGALMSPYANQYLRKRYLIAVQDVLEQRLASAQRLLVDFDNVSNVRKVESVKGTFNLTPDASFYEMVLRVLPCLSIYPYIMCNVVLNNRPPLVPQEASPLPIPPGPPAITLVEPTPLQVQPTHEEKALVESGVRNLLPVFTGAMPPAAASPTQTFASSSNSSTPHTLGDDEDEERGEDVGRQAPRPPVPPLNLQAVLPAAPDISGSLNTSQAKERASKARRSLKNELVTPRVLAASVPGVAEKETSSNPMAVSAGGALDMASSFFGGEPTNREINSMSFSHALSASMASSTDMLSSVIVGEEQAEEQERKSVGSVSPSSRENRPPDTREGTSHQRRGSLTSFLPSNLRALGGYRPGSVPNENGGRVPSSAHSSPDKGGSSRSDHSYASSRSVLSSRSENM